MAQKLILQKKFEQLLTLKQKIQELEEEKYKAQQLVKINQKRVRSTAQTISVLHKQLLDDLTP